MSLQGIPRVTRGTRAYKGLNRVIRVTRGYRCLQGVTWGCKG